MNSKMLFLIMSSIVMLISADCALAASITDPSGDSSSSDIVGLDTNVENGVLNCCYLQ